MEAAHEDLTRVFTSEDKEWLPLAGIPKGEAWIKLIHADEELGKVVFKVPVRFRLRACPAHTQMPRDCLHDLRRVGVRGV